MKNYQKAEMIAKNLPTGSYAAGCPEHTHFVTGSCVIPTGNGGYSGSIGDCRKCEVAY